VCFNINPGFAFYDILAPADCSGWELRLRLLLLDLDVRLDVSVAPGGALIADTNFFGFNNVDLCLGILGLGLAPNFLFSA
jgi:hypothetical protein